MSPELLLALLVAAILSNVVLLVAALRHATLGDARARSLAPRPNADVVRAPASRPMPGGSPHGWPPVPAREAIAAIEQIDAAPAWPRLFADPAEAGQAETAAGRAGVDGTGVEERSAAVATAVAVAEPGADAVAVAVAEPEADALDAALAQPEAHAPGRAEVEPDAGDAPLPVAAPGAEAAAPAAAAIGAPSVTAPSAARRGAGGQAAKTHRAGVRGGRSRRFTLPPMEVDHARTERVVLSLLSSEDPVAPADEIVDVWERLVGPVAGAGLDRSATVVAMTLEGLDRLVESAGRETGERFVTATLDAVRRSARASDRVASVGRGHFRALLVDADDAVATRFVTRVRTSLDRRLAMSPSPLQVAAGWAAADDAAHLETAVRIAEERRRADASPRRRRSGSRSPA